MPIRSNPPSRRLLLPLAAMLTAHVPAIGAAPVGQEPPPPAAIAAQSPAPSPPARLIEAGRNRMAHLFAGTALDLMQVLEPTSDDFRVALILSQWATELDPDWVDGWRVLLRLAAAAEGVDDRTSERMREALSAIVRLDPRDEVSRLRLLSLAVDRFDTVEDRLAAYDQLLDQSNLSKLGSAVAARLAYESAMLLYRSGDIDGFARRLAESVALDPSYPSATEMAAGFLRHNLDDPVGEAELLVVAATANPSNLLPIETLASTSLGTGAYRAAARLYGLLIEVLPVDTPAFASAIEALALARWALGEPQAAVDLLDSRQDALDLIARESAREQDPTLGAVEAAQIRAQPDLRLATLKAVIERSRNGSEADAAMAVALLTVRLAADQIVDESEPGEERDRRLEDLALEGAQIAVWLGEDVAASQRMVDELREFLTLEERAIEQLNAWIDLRNGELDAAIASFEAADNSPLSRIGLAEALERAGRRSEAARLHLAHARESPDTIHGIWSRTRLERLLERPLPPSETANAVDAVVAQLPRTYDRLLLDRERAISLTLRTPAVAVPPMGRLIVEIEIANLTDLPLAIDPVGPIEPNLAIISAAQLVEMEGTIQANPMVVPIGRRLRLEPRERLVFPVDLGLGSLGDVLDRTALSGSTVQSRVLSNFRPVSGGALQPGMLGAKAQGAQIRVDGVRISTGWVEDSLAAIRTPDEPGDLVLMYLLGTVSAATEASSDAIPEGEFEAIKEVFPALYEAWPAIGPEGRGWLLALLPPIESEGIEGLVERSRHSEDAVTIVGYLLGRVDAPDDPILIDALASDDPRVRAIAELLASRVGGPTSADVP